MNEARIKFKNLRAIKQVSVYRICKDLGIPNSTVYDWVDGKTENIASGTYEKMMNYLKKQ